MIFKNWTQLRGCKQMRRAVLLFGMFALLHAAARGDDRKISIVPQPSHLQLQSGSLDLSHGLAIDVPADNPEASSAARYFSDLNAKTHAVDLKQKGVGESPAPGVIFAHRAPHVAGKVDESYELQISPKEIRISASSHAGYLYGVVTLWQLLMEYPKSLPALLVQDEPRFRWRGIMLDSARHMQSEAFLLQTLDYMAQHKLNVFHWHLVDDQGWRIEIKRYPKLASVGAWRAPIMPPYQEGAGAQTKLYGGFYTQKQIRAIVAYAKERNITVVPEIEMPGHASAALAAYPEFGSAATPITMPPSGWGIFPNLYNVNDATFEFLQNILLEVMELFPSEYIHIGGDEAIKNQWKSNEAVQERMRDLHIHEEDQMQSWFVGRIEKFLNAHGRKMIGWDEILEGGLAPNSTVMSWRGIKGGIAAAQQGHDTVITPYRPLYFNYRQSDAADEPTGRAPLNTLSDVYRFDPVFPSLTPAQQGHVLGVEACLWSEYVITEDLAEHMLFPRMAALAEVGWTPAAHMQYQDFLGRLPMDMQRARAIGLHPAESVFAVQEHAVPLASGKQASLTLSTQSGYGEIHYTLDGSNVQSTSPRFSSPIEIPLPSTIKAASFDGDTLLATQMAKTLTLNETLRRDSRELDLCGTQPGIVLEQDPPRNAARPAFLVAYQHPCWIYRKAELSRVGAITVGVASIPYIFNDVKRQLPPVAQEQHVSAPSLEVRMDSCTGQSVASVSLSPAMRKDGVTELHAEHLAVTDGVHDLCFVVQSSDPQTVWLLNFVQPVVK